MTEILTSGEMPRPNDPETALIYGVYGIDSLNGLNEAEAAWVNTQIDIARHFSGVDDKTGAWSTISPGRARAITAISVRHVKLMKPARGTLTNEQLLEAWQERMPERHGRHPDLLFDMTQMNFGTDEPVTHIEHSIMRSELERRQLYAQVRAALRRGFVEQRFRGELPEDYVD